jgi:hypothetical protein
MQTELKVAITGAFLTGRSFGSGREDRSLLQAELGRHLKSLPGRTWEMDTVDSRQDGTYESGGGFATTLPLVLARRENGDMLTRVEAALRRRRDENDDWLIEETRRWRLTASSVQIEIYDLGIAVMDATLKVQLPRNASLPRVAQTLRRLVRLATDPVTCTPPSPIAETLQKLAEETASEFASAVDQQSLRSVEDDWLFPRVSEPPTAAGRPQQQSDDWGRLLWLHPVLEIRDAKDLNVTAVQLAPTFHQKIPIEDGLFIPGVGWSAIVTRGAATSGKTILRLTQRHWAYFALYMHMDRVLLQRLDDVVVRPGAIKRLRLNLWHKRGRLGALEQDADSVFRYHAQVMAARARLDSMPTTIGGDEVAIWEAICAVQKFDALVVAVERKVKELLRLAEHLVQQATIRRARVTSNVLGTLTALTLVTLATAVLTNFIGSGSGEADQYTPWRIGVVIVPAVLAIAAWWAAARGELWRRSQSN